jgi:HK97 gp10 family phage protein
MGHKVTSGITFQYNHLPQLQKELGERVILALDKGAAIIESESKAAAPFASGALRASGFRISAVHNDYAAAVTAMEARNPSAQATLPPHTEKNEVVIGFAADYAIFVHDGTHSMAGRPFLVETAERHKDDLITITQQILQDGAEGKSMPKPDSGGE